MKIENVAMIGIGAVGAVVASQLNDYLGKNHLFCIMDKDRIEKYEKSGIFINGEKQDFNLVLPEDVPECDLVIIATKNLQLQQVITQIKKAVGPNTKILSLLNGIQSERDLAQAYGEDKILYSFVISLNSINLDGTVEVSNKGTLVFGEKNNEKTDAVKEICRLLENSKIRYSNPEDILLEMWKKYLINVTFNSLSAITRSTYGGFNYDVMKKLSRQVGREVIAVANAEGIKLTEEHLESDIALMCSHDPYGKTSMLQDMEAKRLSENQFFCGTIIKLAEKHSIPVPCCEFLCDLIDGTEKVRNV